MTIRFTRYYKVQPDGPEYQEGSVHTLRRESEAYFVESRKAAVYVEKRDEPVKLPSDTPAVASSESPAPSPASQPAPASRVRTAKPRGPRPMSSSR